MATDTENLFILLESHVMMLFCTLIMFVYLELVATSIEYRGTASKWRFVATTQVLAPVVNQ